MLVNTTKIGSELNFLEEKGVMFMVAQMRAMIEHVDAPLMPQHTLGSTNKLRPAGMIDR